MLITGKFVVNLPRVYCDNTKLKPPLFSNHLDKLRSNVYNSVFVIICNFRVMFAMFVSVTNSKALVTFALSSYLFSISLFF